MTYDLFKEKTPFPLHQAIRMNRDDVLFLYLLDNDADVSEIERRRSISVSLRFS